MSPENVRERITELEEQIESEQDPTEAIHLICKKLDLLEVLISMQDREAKAKSV